MSVLPMIPAGTKPAEAVGQTFLPDNYNRISPAKSGSPPGYDKLMHSVQHCRVSPAKSGSPCGYDKLMHSA